MPEHSKGKKNRKYNRDRVKGSQYANADTRIKNTPKCNCADKGISCSHKRKVRDPKRMPHGERRTQRNQDRTVRKVPKHVPNGRDDAYRNGFSSAAVTNSP